MNEIDPPALEMLAEQASEIRAGGPEIAAEQPDKIPRFRLGLQLAGTKGSFKGKKILALGGGDVWVKFVHWALQHLGVEDKDITILELSRPDNWRERFGEINCVTQAEYAENPGLLENQDFSLVVNLLPPEEHLNGIKLAWKLGLPSMVEKPALSSPEEYAEFELLQKQYNIPVYFMDWQVLLATSLYKALGYDVPFEDAVTYVNREALKFDLNDVVRIKGRFIEGGDHPQPPGRGEWLQRGGVLSDTGSHLIEILTVLGYRLDLVYNATLGTKIPGELGVYKLLAKEEPGHYTGETYARVEAGMKLNNDGPTVDVSIEVAKAGLDNDMRIDLIDSKGRILRYRFGAETSVAELIVDGEIVASATFKADPYALMFIHADHIFTKSPDSVAAVFGRESFEMIKVLQESQRAGREYDVPSPLSTVSQISYERIVQRKVDGLGG